MIILIIAIYITFKYTSFFSFNPWHSGHNKSDVEFDFYICGAPKYFPDSDCDNSLTVIGYNTTEQKEFTLGECSKSNLTTESLDGEVMVMTNGSDCPVHDGYKMTTVIYFKCGKTLVSSISSKLQISNVYIYGVAKSVVFLIVFSQFCQKGSLKSLLI